MILLVAACSDKESPKGEAETDSENFNETGMPIVKEPIKLNIFAGKVTTANDNWNDILVLNEYKKMTNMDINWNQVPIDGLAEKRNLALASGDLPDVFYGSYLPPSDLLKYGEQGIFIPLNDLIDKYAPNLKKVMEEFPEVKKGITFPDGNIYSLPTLHHPDFTSGLMEAKPWINQDWLDQLGIENPETTDEFYEYLKLVKTTDLNGNGKNDEIPFSSVSMGRILHWISGAFGVSNRGIMHQLIDENPETGDLRFYPIEDGYKDMLEYVNKLYTEGLIEENIYSIKVDQYLANAAEELYGATNFFNPRVYFGDELGAKWGPGKALEGPNGDKMYTGLTSAVRGLGHFSITSENKYPAETIRWMDYFYSEEGAKMFFMGIEGETYEETADGPKLMDKITNSPDGLTMQQELAKYLTNPGGGHAILNYPEFYTGPEGEPEDIALAEEIKPYLIDEAWPVFTYTVDESKDIVTLGGDIGKYVGEMQAKFITGDIPFSEWDKYVKTVQDIGLDKYMEIQEQAYARYKD